jgi:putative polyhydroxyalkanoate system protein
MAETWYKPAKEEKNMAEVVVVQPHQCSLEEAKEKVLAFEELIGKYGVKAIWKGYKAKLKGIGVSGSIEVTSGEVRVTVSLGLLAKTAGVDPVRLKASIERRLGPAFS